MGLPAHVHRKQGYIHQVLSHHIVEHWGHPSHSQGGVSQAQNSIKLCVHKGLARLRDTLSKLLADHKKSFHLMGESRKENFMGDLWERVSDSQILPLAQTEFFPHPSFLDSMCTVISFPQPWFFNVNFKKLKYITEIVRVQCGAFSQTIHPCQQAPKLEAPSCAL